jgi:hypothetical protein
MGESVLGPRKGVTEAIALLLGVQPGKNNLCRLLLQIGHLLGCCSYKNDALHRCYSHVPAIGQR